MFLCEIQFHKMKTFLGLITLLCIFYQGYTQDAVLMEADTLHNIKFTDGVYFTIADLQHNTPSITKDQLIKSYYDQSDFSIGQWAATQNLFYTGKNESKLKVNRDSLWGYVENGTPYIYLNDRFHRFSTAGAVSIFRESYPNLKVGLAPVVTEAKSTSQVNLYILSSGKIEEFTPENVASAIKGNKALYDEFMALKSWKQKRKKMYRFVERYNDSVK